MNLFPKRGMVVSGWDIQSKTAYYQVTDSGAGLLGFKSLFSQASPRRPTSPLATVAGMQGGTPGYHTYARETRRHMSVPQATARGDPTFNIDVGYIPSDDTAFLQSWVFSGDGDRKQKACQIE